MWVCMGWCNPEAQNLVLQMKKHLIFSIKTATYNPAYITGYMVISFCIHCIELVERKLFGVKGYMDVR